MENIKETKLKTDRDRKRRSEIDKGKYSEVAYCGKRNEEVFACASDMMEANGGMTH